MDEPITEPSASARPVTIEYFNAVPRPRRRHRFSSISLRAMVIAMLAFACTFAGIAMGMGKTDPGPVMIFPVWVLGVWYVAERCMAGRSSRSVRLSLAACAVIAASLVPLLTARGGPSVLTDLLRYGWGTPFVSTTERVLLVVTAAAIAGFFVIRLSDPVSRHERKIARRLAHAQHRRLEQQNRLLRG